MMKRLALRMRNHPIPWWVHPVLLAICVKLYGYYFSFIKVPIDSGLDAFYLAIQQLLFFYPAICWALPDTLETLRKRWAVTLLKVLLLLFIAENFINVVSVLHGQLDMQFSSWTNFVYDVENDMWSFPLVSVTVLITLFYQSLVILLNEQRLKKETTATLNRQLDEVASAWYEMQLNPHLMNSMLTVVRQLVAIGSPNAYEAVQTMNRIMRHYLKLKPGTNLIPLEDELEQARRLLALYCLSHGRPCYLKLDIRLTPGLMVHVPPMLILMLVKNMLKHGDVFDPNRQAVVQLVDREERLVIKAENVIKQLDVGSLDEEEGTHTGLFQIERKLKQRYGSNSSFTHGPVGDEFHVYLEIPLHVVFFE